MQCVSETLGCKIPLMRSGTVGLFHLSQPQAKQSKANSCAKSEFVGRLCFTEYTISLSLSPSLSHTLSQPPSAAPLSLSGWGCPPVSDQGPAVDPPRSLLSRSWLEVNSGSVSTLILCEVIVEGCYVFWSSQPHIRCCYWAASFLRVDESISECLIVSCWSQSTNKNASGIFSTIDVVNTHLNSSSTSKVQGMCFVFALWETETFGADMHTVGGPNKRNTFHNPQP